ncbi:MAG: hypothetical protein BMS9Abin12_1644 [Acidimicrobiia bacterium]|nr:MAG: hypothetical protein BMS9Abin12_1644 [Acidimicrobiia bacterium]
MTKTASRIDDYDAVIIGSSFAGLAAASQLRDAGRVLLVDREPLGAGETSACGTLLAVLERLDALDALEQVHPQIAVNAAGRRITFRPGYAFATFDYRTLCEILASRLEGVETAVATMGGVDADGALVIGDRRVRCRVLVDASGWRAVLAREHGAPPPDPAHRSVGSELRHGHGGYDLELWLRPDESPDGVFWAFPAGGHTREGVASYTGRGAGLRSALARFVNEESLPSRAVHGGVFPSRLRDPVAGPVFVVGDAAGQCLPVSGEGIRPALVWGQEAGRQAARVLRGDSTLDAALAAYRNQVLAHRRLYRTLEWLQAAMLHVPHRLLPVGVSLFTQGPSGRSAARWYWDVADPDTLEIAPGVRSVTRATAAQSAIGRVGALPNVVSDAADSHAAAPIR